MPVRRVASEKKKEFFSWDLNEKKEPARPRSDRRMYQAAGTPSAKTLKLKVAWMFEEQKAGLQGQGTISEESSSSRENGRVGQGPNYVSPSQREGTLRVSLRGPRQLKSEGARPSVSRFLVQCVWKSSWVYNPFFPFYRKLLDYNCQDQTADRIKNFALYRLEWKIETWNKCVSFKWP